jgi:Na+-driven multidrug efflux pump
MRLESSARLFSKYPMIMGIQGAALATALGPIFSVLILLPHFLRKKGQLYFVRGKTQAKEAGRIFTLGFPSFIMEFTIGIITFVYNRAIIHNGYG